MTPEDVLQYCLKNLEGTVPVESWGERGILYNPEKRLKRGVYVLTVKEKDGENDSASNLNREGIYRVNVGVRKQTFTRLFGPAPKRPEKGGVVDMPLDFSVVDQLLLHPVYAWMGWVCVLSPSEQTFEALRPLIQEGYEYAKEKFEKKKL